MAADRVPPVCPERDPLALAAAADREAEYQRRIVQAWRRPLYPSVFTHLTAIP